MGAAPVHDHSALEWKLEKKLKEVEITAEDFMVAKECVRELRHAAQELGEGWCVRPFGSICNGFAKHGSDLDATCCWDGSTKQTALLDAWDLLEGLLPIVQANPRFQTLKEIRNARVPLLKLKFDGKLEVDLSFQNTEPLPNTQLLRAYVCLHPLVRALGMLVKLWAEAAGVCGAPNGNLSAYSFTLMATYFMQAEPHMRLPCLPIQYFRGGDEIPQAARVSWTCDLHWSSRAWLLHRFFCFFAGEFRWGQEVVSIRLGRRAAADDPAFSQLRGRFDARLHIEDPFLTARNLHCVLRPEQEAILHTKLCEAANAMSHGILPVGLACNNPEPERRNAHQARQVHPLAEKDLGLGEKATNPKGSAVMETTGELGSGESAALKNDWVGEDLQSRKEDMEVEAGGASTTSNKLRSDGQAATASKSSATLSIRELSQASPAAQDLPMTVLQGRWWF